MGFNMRTSKLFVYGQLKPGSKYHAHSILKPQKATIRAELHDLGKDVGAKKIGKTSKTGNGYIVTIPTTKLHYFDKIEKPQFERIKTKTTNNQEVWVYKYLKNVSKRDKIIKNFKVKK